MNAGSEKPRIALLSDEGRAWKLDALRQQASALYRCDIFTVSSSGVVTKEGGNPVTTSPSMIASSYDLVFSKIKDDVALTVLDALEAENVRLINTPASIRHSKHRPRATAAAAAAGVPVPRDFSGALAEVPFERFVIKNEQDDNDAQIPVIIEDAETRARITAELGADRRVYVQEKIETELEFKVYGIGDELYGFAQRPILVNPNKHETRRVLDVPESLAVLTRKTLAAVGLEIGGVDFLGSLDRPAMTDVNSTQGLQNFPEGYAALIRYFGQCLS